MNKTDYNDIIGKTFGKLTVIKFLGLKKYTCNLSNGKTKLTHKAMYLCKCTCGNDNYITDRYSLTRTDGKGNKSCGTCAQRDILGKTFGDLTVIEFIGYKNSSDCYYRCRCKCGGETESRRSHLLSGESKSCGLCVQNFMIGKKFNHITVLALTGKNKHNQQKALCKCDCGNIYETDLYCIKKYNSCQKCFNVLPDSYKEPFHSNCVRLSWIFEGIYQRCNNANNTSFYNYGGRGIKCLFSREEFVTKFYKLDLKDLQVDRINNDGPYSFDNIRWVTNYDNAQNKERCYESTYEKVASRLRPKDQHLKSLIVDNKPIDLKEFYIVEFSNLVSYTGENTLCLYIHKSIKYDMFSYINRIIKYYKDGGKNISYSRIYRYDDGSVHTTYGTFDNCLLNYIDSICEVTEEHVETVEGEII